MSDTSVVQSVFEAAQKGHTEELEQLLLNRSHEEVQELVNTKTESEQTALVAAAIHGYKETAAFLVESCSADIELKGSAEIPASRTRDTTTLVKSGPPLWYAAAQGHLEIVKFLISKSADINSHTENRSTPLRAASFDGDLEIVKFLVENGADVNKANKYGHSPLHLACYFGWSEIARLLLDNGAEFLSDDIGKVHLFGSLVWLNMRLFYS